MLLIRSQIYNILMYLAVFFIGLFHVPAAARSKEGVYRAVKVYSRLNKWLLKKLCGITYEVRGVVPSEPCIVLSKHMSWLDICIIGEALPDVKFIMKQQITRIPVLGYLAKQIGSTPVERGHKKGAANMMKDMKKSDEINQDGQLVIFPQGTRVLPEQKLPYKKGAWYIYRDKELPVYLAATNVGVLWGRKSAYRYPGHVVLEFLPVRIEAGMEMKPFMDIISKEIETRSDELMAEYPRGYKH